MVGAPCTPQSRPILGDETMAYVPNQRHIDIAFSSGSLLQDGKAVQFQHLEIGQLLVTSGALAASDPFVFPNPAPFTQTIPAGRYPVSIAIVSFGTDDERDERVAFARVELSNSPAVSWTMALTEGQDSTTLEHDGFFGYGVDAGTGCFMDPVAGRLLADRMDKDDEYFNVIIEEMEKTYRHTRSWLDWRPSPGRDENIICFSSGWGDGHYPSFFGFSGEGHPCALLTDFFVLSDAENAA
jgi:uncharacterized protein DUF4241